MTTLIPKPHILLRLWLKRQLPGQAWSWVSTTVKEVNAAADDALLYRAISLVARKVGKAGLLLSGQDLELADQSRSGWQPQGWSLAQATRLYILLSTWSTSTVFVHRLKQLCITADVEESIALYQGLPLYPDPGSLLEQAREGLRSNIKTVFEAVAHHSPYPQENFPEDAWNQMVLKAIFIGSPLASIQGLNARRNTVLAQALINYVLERKAANRSVTAELWCLLTPYVNEATLAALQSPLNSDSLVESQTAALALGEGELPASESAASLQRDSRNSLDAYAGLALRKIVKDEDS